MSVKAVYQTDQSGIFVGVVAADESPLEPGVFLIPAGCVETPPPQIPADMAARWVNGKWVLETIPVAPASPPEPEPEPQTQTQTPEQVQKAFEDAIQLHMDNAAQTFGYDSVQTAVTYAEEPAWPKFQLEGQGFRAWRSLVWAYAHEQLALVTSGQRAQPSILQLIEELPALVIPEPEPVEPAPEEEPAP